MADLAYLRTRLEVVDKEIKDTQTALKTTERELLERPQDDVLLAQRDRLVNDLQRLYARQKNLEDSLTASLPAATALAPGLGSADGAGTASAANQGAVPLLGTGGDGSWFWLLFGHFAAVADRYPSPHRHAKRGGLQALQLVRQHQD
ncbi:hypothetical protein CHLRE_02g086456v5 [Chlamydomonas reinhardtii]|uniref:Uncharacterized protein n=1 Tax=Chlamydomonas reinhardtii TaxID=3055 RepID=A8I8M7_CHLRE|nr:uncharacterized protein CHLRE_02g086456v5 [Chlamydomonas reinhardtii]PNW86441.1 hypothetical protein CHLRE_02g086456v5 [Chlamydomonas reinhardtii]|eukprot:XP_001701934.1 predicted protein [Chlamydomonas reinhardtii]